MIAPAFIFMCLAICLGISRTGKTVTPRKWSKKMLLLKVDQKENYVNYSQSPATANVSPGRPKSVYMGQHNQ